MPAQCEICNKGSMTGGRERRTGTRGFLKKRVKRTFKPNLRKVTINTDNGKKQVRMCAKCLKRMKKDKKDQEG